MPRYADTTQYSIQEISLWEQLIENQHRLYHTTKGLSFTYNIQGNELFVSRKEKSITRATVNMAYQKAKELGGGELPAVVKGPKTLGVFGASYLYPVFAEIGVIKTPATSPAIALAASPEPPTDPEPPIHTEKE